MPEAAIRSVIDPDTLVALKSRARRWYELKVELVEQSVVVDKDWKPASGEGDSLRYNYVWSEKLQNDRTEVLAVRVDQLRIEDIVRAIYGPLPP